MLILGASKQRINPEVDERYNNLREIIEDKIDKHISKPIDQPSKAPPNSTPPRHLSLSPGVGQIWLLQRSGTMSRMTSKLPQEISEIPWYQFQLIARHTSVSPNKMAATAVQHNLTGVSVAVLAKMH